MSEEHALDILTTLSALALPCKLLSLLFSFKSDLVIETFALYWPFLESKEEMQLSFGAQNNLIGNMVYHCDSVFYYLLRKICVPPFN